MNCIQALFCLNDPNGEDCGDVSVIDKTPLIEKLEFNQSEMTGLNPAALAESQSPFGMGKVDLLTITIQELQGCLCAGTVTSVQLVKEYLRRIEQDNHQGLGLGAVIETAHRQDLIDEASRLDNLRISGVTLSGLHGIPLLVKDSMATRYEKGRHSMQTTAGCIALEGSIVPGDAAVIANLRKKGAIILGKANLNELSGAMIASPHERLEWSGRGGRCFSAYVEGGDPSGSSSGSAVGASAGFAAAALGGDTTGSITFPSSKAACFSIRPTLGLIPTSGTIPLAKYMDTLGPIAKSAYDAALLLTHMVDPKQDLCAGAESQQDTVRPEYPSDSASPSLVDYTKYTTSPFSSFKGKRLGVPRKTAFDDIEIWKAWWPGDIAQDDLDHMHESFNHAVARMQDLGAVIEDPADMLSLGKIDVSSISMDIITHEFRGCFEAYLDSLKESKIKSLEELVVYKEGHPETDISPSLAASQLKRLQVVLHAEGPGSPEYLKAVAQAKRFSGEEGVIGLLDKLGLDALIVPADHVELVRYASIGGSPIACVPLGVLRKGQPFGLCFLGRKGSEPTLIALMSAFEANFPARAIPLRVRHSS